MTSGVGRLVMMGTLGGLDSVPLLQRTDGPFSRLAGGLQATRDDCRS